MFSPPERDEDVPDIVPGEVVHTDNGDVAYKVIKQVTIQKWRKQN